jgi:hypothetical protein
LFETAAAGPVVTVKKAKRFLRRLFQAAVEIIKKKSAKPPLSISTAAAVSTGPSGFLSFLVLFSFFVERRLWKKDRGFCDRK